MFWVALYQKTLVGIVGILCLFLFAGYSGFSTTCLHSLCNKKNLHFEPNYKVFIYIKHSLFSFFHICLVI